MITDPCLADDDRTAYLLVDIRQTLAEGDAPPEFAHLIEGALVESYARRYDGTYPPAGHTYPEVRG
ncbi:hypothetical protein ACFXDE_02030 [Kitasatospora sp. NPDC059408]|uniref:hypothetical protein n=1 Tax=Kitasatospora sp. NPDC059408 TaxID=3346823 RepID=UPI0036A942E1